MTINEKAPGVSDDSKGLTADTNDLNFATGQRPGKAIATQIAELEIAGYRVYVLADGGYCVTHGDMAARHCVDFTELQSFTQQQGGAHD